jgi:hypothetical protein
MVIGVSGVAGSGKDTFFKIFKDLLGKREVKRFALATALKQEAGNWTIPNYGIDPLNCSRAEKEIIRPFLVFHGVSKRHKSNGRHWINQLNDEILPFKESEQIAVITDIRYAEYEKDEFYWLKEELGGLLVHVSTYSTKKDSNEGALLLEFSTPANEEEFRNDPNLKKNADYVLEWPEIRGGLNVEEELKPYVERFIEKINI